MRLLRRAAALAPLLAAVALWAAGSAAVLLAVSGRTDFVMEEVRRHGLVADLSVKMAWLAIPYVLLGACCALAAWGLLRLGAAAPRPPGGREGALGLVLLGLVLAATVVQGAAERPAVFAGLLYAKGGARRAFQLAIERHVSPEVFGPAALAVAGLVVLLALAGLLRHASRRGRAGALAGLGLAALLVGAGAAARRGAPPGAGPPNLLVIVVDSLRTDALDPGSPFARATPSLRAFAGEAVRLTGVRTPVARTYPSMASLLTGLHPIQHGVRNTYAASDERARLSSSVPRLLREAGYVTGAVSGYCGSEMADLDLGFEVLRCPRSEIDLVTSIAAQRGHPWLTVWLRRPWMRRLFPTMREGVETSHPDDVNGEAIAAWRAARRPFFLTVFYDNTHLPYLPVWPESSLAGGYTGPNRYAIAAGDLLEQVRAGEGAPLQRAVAEEAANARRLYTGALAGVDRALGRLLSALAGDGLAERTVVVVLGDHGENLLDAGGPLAHGEAAERDRSPEIPVLVRGPGLPPRTLADALAIQDLAPTLLDLAGAPVPAGLEGRSIAPRLRGGPALPERPLLIETDLWWLARDTVDRLDPTGRGLAYPSLVEGLLTIEPGRPPHIVVAPRWREDVLRAKQRRLDLGPWTLTYLPREGGASLRLYRRDLDPWLTRDLAAVEPERLHDMTRLLYAEAARLGDGTLIPPEQGSAR